MNNIKKRLFFLQYIQHLKGLHCQAVTAWTFTYPVPALAFGFEADNRLSLGLVHNYSPLVWPCQTNNAEYVRKLQEVGQ